jgi:hypothetical protein
MRWKDIANPLPAVPAKAHERITTDAKRPQSDTESTDDESKRPIAPPVSVNKTSATKEDAWRGRANEQWWD